MWNKRDGVAAAAAVATAAAARPADAEDPADIKCGWW